MIAVDTNLLVRVLTGDDPAQARRAVKILESDQILIPKTVILETEWVLRYAYEIETSRIIGGLKKLLGLPNVSVEDPDTVTQAISWFEDGLDFADALHLASSKRADKFVTFDRAFAKKARNVTALKVVKP
jgi:predicted nucleic-acid-binding protein